MSVLPVQLGVPARSQAPEMMDRPGLEAADIGAALGDVRLVNRFLGGRRTLLRGITPLIREAPRHRPLTLVDVGTGSADLPQAMLQRARELGRELRVLAVDLDPSTAAVAAARTRDEPAIQVLRADAFRLPLRAGCVDFVTASMFLHHFRHEQIVSLLRSWRRIARGAVLVNDLRRHLLPWAFIAALARTTRRHPVFVHDAPLSVLRGFTPDELSAAARGAGAPDARLRPLWPYRLLLCLPAQARTAEAGT